MPAVLPTTESRYSHLVCSKTGQVYDAHCPQTYSEAGKPLWATYNLSNPPDRDSLRNRPMTMWRYREMLPVFDPAFEISLGEGGTPLIPLTFDASNLRRLFLKEEAFNPTGSFKARGLAMAVSKAAELGIRHCVIPTAGNAGGALSAYCAKAGLRADVYLPQKTPLAFQRECQFFGAQVHLIDGTIKDCAAAIKAEGRTDWFDVSTLKEPFRLEGKKTMGYEIAEQLGWQTPDVVVYPTGGGTGLIGIWKAFQEMAALGWTDGQRPRMVAVQTAGCAPIVQAFERGATQAVEWENPAPTTANGLRVPTAFADELILQILKESQGTALRISEFQMNQTVGEVARQSGILLSPEGAAVYAAFRQLQAQGWIDREETVVLLNTGSMYKYLENFA